MTDVEREIAELVVELSELDPWASHRGSGCLFCGTLDKDMHKPHCLWKRAAAWRWRSSTAKRGF